MTKCAINSKAASLLHAELVIEELFRCGVELFCVSPGARAIPLITALAANSDYQVKLFNDERAAAFYAQAFGRSGRLACLICTSGTAAANYLPGIIEAGMSHVPLVVLTADRPVELSYARANQTIDQRNLFGKYCCRSLDIAAPESRIFPHSLLSNVDQIVAAARSERQPAHLNIAYRKPFVADDSRPLSKEETEERELIERWRSAKRPYTSFVESACDIGEKDAARIAAAIDAANQPLIVCGPLAATESKREVVGLAERISAPVFADINSQLRFASLAEEGESERFVFADYNLFIRQLDQSAPRPDLILYFGDRILSEPLREYLEPLPQEGVELILISPVPGRQDAIENEFIQPTERIVAPVAPAAAALCRLVEHRPPSELLQRCRELEAAVARQLEPFLCADESGALPLEAEIVRRTFTGVTGGSAVYLGVSLVFRQAEFFSGSGAKDVCIGANRGATGIDGVLASALGYGTGLAAPTTLLIGDQSLLHDLNSLALVAESPQPTIIVVLNNSGGAIFNFFSLGEADRLMVNRHRWNFAGAAEMFGLNYLRIDSVRYFTEMYDHAQRTGGHWLFEVIVDGEKSVEIFRTSPAAVLDPAAGS